MTQDRLVGRPAAEDEARAMLGGSARLVTLWGPPGVGKSHLARALVADLDDAHWLSSNQVDDLAGLTAAVAPRLEADGGPSCLVLDALEPLLAGQHADGVLTQLESWLDVHEGLRILVTSRRRLGLTAEHVVALEPLSDDETLELFLSHVRQNRPDALPDEEDRAALLPAIACLDGLPLAVELAAGRWELLGTQALSARLAAPLAVLTRSRGDEARHASLRDAIGASWDLLDSASRRVLMGAAAFAGPFTVADAEAVVGADALDHLEALRDDSLVQVDAPGSFALLGCVRAFAREQTPDDLAGQLAEAHARWCLEAKHVGPADLQAAARFLVSRADPRAGELLERLGAEAPGRHLALLDAAVAQLDTPPIRRARGRARRLLGQLDAAREDFVAGLAMADDPAERTRLLRMLGVLEHGRGDLDAAAAHYEHALDCAREAGNLRDQAVTVGNLGAIDHDLCRYERAELRYEEALAGLRQVSDRAAEATILANQAVLRQEQGQLEAAEAAYRSALSLVVAAGDRRTEAITRGNLGLLLHELGRPTEARQLHLDAWQGWSDIPDAASRGLCLARLGAVEAVLDDTAAARSHLEQAAREVAVSPDALARDVVTLFMAFLAQAEGRHDEVSRRLDDAQRAIRVSGDARVAARLLRAASQAPAPALEVGDDWFAPPHGERADLTRYLSLRRMVRALADAHQAGPDRALDVDALFDAGWPGERIAHESRRNRVHVNLAKLRTLGLRGLLVRGSGGYQLDPAVPVRRVT